AAAGFRPGGIVNFGEIEVEGWGESAAGIRLGSARELGPHAANKGVMNQAVIVVRGAHAVDGITAYGHGHFISNSGLMVVTGPLAAGIHAKADEGVDGQTVRLVNEVGAEIWVSGSLGE